VDAFAAERTPLQALMSAGLSSLGGGGSPAAGRQHVVPPAAAPDGQLETAAGRDEMLRANQTGQLRRARKSVAPAAGRPHRRVRPAGHLLRRRPPPIWPPSIVSAPGTRLRTYLSLSLVIAAAANRLVAPAFSG
jgi:hypothetical protein